MKKDEAQITNQELERIIRKAYRRAAKLFRDEPRPIFISGSAEDNSDNTTSEIVKWLFHRRQDNGTEGKRNHN